MRLENTIERSDSQGIPLDLAEWLGPRPLLRLTLDAVQTLDWEPRDLNRAGHPAERPQMLMTLLTYCYAAAIYGSEDIEWAIRNNATVRYICAHNYPDWRTLRRFRREHRQAIKRCLTQVLLQAWALKLDEAELDYPGYSYIENTLLQRVENSAQNRLETAAILDRFVSEC